MNKKINIYTLENGKADDFKKLNKSLEGYSHRIYLHIKIRNIFMIWRRLLQYNEFYNSQFGPRYYVDRAFKEIHKILDDVNANGNNIDYINYYVLLDGFIKGLQNDERHAEEFKKKFENYKVQVAPQDNLEINPQDN